jgi:hypothetical protein
VKSRGAPALAAALALAASVALCACAPGPGPATITATATAAATASPANGSPAKGSPAKGSPAPGTTAPTPAGPVALPVAPDGDGARAQTSSMPRTDNAAFRNLVADVWLSVTTGTAGYARPAFFPVAAYKQVKAIAYPEGDWTSRLWYDYALDAKKAHQLVGSGARLVTVIVPKNYAVWVPVNACYNKVGYWHVPGARVVYRDKAGKVRSFGIASLISWRGVWYVIHFGAVTRDIWRGYVDDPQDGPGTPGPPGGC